MNNQVVDRYFDRLPDDILVDIVDKLNWKDAAITSILSPRFRNVWESVGGLLEKNLVFEDDNDRPSWFKFEEEFADRVLSRHDKTSINSLRIAFPAANDVSYDEAYRNLIGIARTKCVAHLEIDLQHTVEEARDCRSFPRFMSDNGWDELTSLTLRSVYVTRVDLKLLMNNFVNLESLFIEDVEFLREVAFSSLKLKRLEIRNCYRLCRIDIDHAPNLEYFKHSRRSALMIEKYVDVEFKHVPKLSYAYLGAPLNPPTYYWTGTWEVDALEKLEMDLGHYVDSESWKFYEYFPMLRNLKELHLSFSLFRKSGFYRVIFADILAACPRLHRLTLYCGQFETESRKSYTWQKKDLLERYSSHRYIHECLREVEFLGWQGRGNEVEAVELIKKVAPNLEKIVNFHMYL